LIARHFDGRRSEAVLLIDQEDDVEAEPRQNIARDDHRERYVRPLKPMIERRHDEQGGKPHARKQHDDSLQRALLRGWPPAQTALQKRGIILDQIQRYQQRRPKKYRQIAPRLPIPGRARRNEQQAAHCDGEKSYAEGRPYLQVAHFTNLYLPHKCG